MVTWLSLLSLGKWQLFSSETTFVDMSALSTHTDIKINIKLWTQCWWVCSKNKMGNTPNGRWRMETRADWMQRGTWMQRRQRWRERLRGRKTAEVGLTNGAWPLTAPQGDLLGQGLGWLSVPWMYPALSQSSSCSDPGRVLLHLSLPGNILEGKGRACIREAVRKGVSSGILGNAGFPLP